jgi:hypothetical protein
MKAHVAVYRGSLSFDLEAKLADSSVPICHVKLIAIERSESSRRLDADKKRKKKKSRSKCAAFIQATPRLINVQCVLKSSRRKHLRRILATAAGWNQTSILYKMY